MNMNMNMIFKATFNSSVILGFGWSLWYFSSMARCSWIQIWRVWVPAWVPLSLLSEPVRIIQSVLHDAPTLTNEGCLDLNSIILSFSDVFQPNLVMKCMFDCLTVM